MVATPTEQGGFEALRVVVEKEGVAGYALLALRAQLLRAGNKTSQNRLNLALLS